MARNYTYNTKQKKQIMNVITEYEKPFTVREIRKELENKIGLTTIYRLVDKMVEEDKLKKQIGKNNKTYYQFLKECDRENHFYLKCENCEKIIHIDCDCIEELSNHILKNHRFKLSKKNIIISGICDKCLGGKI